MTLSPQTAGDAIFLEVVKEAPESGFSGLYLAASVWLLRCQTSGPALKASIPQSGPYVSLHFLRLIKTFLGQCSSAHGERGCRSVSEGARSHFEVTWLRAPGTPVDPKQGVAGRPMAAETLKRQAKLDLPEGRRQQWETVESSCWAALH